MSNLIFTHIVMLLKAVKKLQLTLFEGPKVAREAVKKLQLTLFEEPKVARKAVKKLQLTPRDIT